MKVMLQKKCKRERTVRLKSLEPNRDKHIIQLHTRANQTKSKGKGYK